MGLALRIIGSTIINDDDSAFPTIVRIDNGDLICGFSFGGGPEATGGTGQARSADGGETWTRERDILPPSEEKDGTKISNSLRLGREPGGRVIAYGQRNRLAGHGAKFGTLENDAVFMVSDKDCRNWTGPSAVAFRHDCPLEISNPMLALSDGRWLAPAALLPSKDRLGEKVVVAESEDSGMTWKREHTVFSDPDGEKGFFEQKLIETAPGRLFAFAWTVRLKGYEDLQNHFVTSSDGGKTWSLPRSLSTKGQTMTPLWMGGASFLLVYNDRGKEPCIRLAEAEFTGKEMEIVADIRLWSPPLAKASEVSGDGVDKFDEFSFGYPSLLRLANDMFLAAYWRKDSKGFGVESSKFRLESIRRSPANGADLNSRVYYHRQEF